MKEDEIYKLPCTHRFLVKYLIELIDKNTQMSNMQVPNAISRN